MAAMTTITIRERTSPGPNGENATVSFDGGPQYDITVSDPFSEQQERQLEWYFEEHLVYPFTDQVKAEHCGESVTEYGETLFQQVFVDNHEVYSEYKDCVRNGLNHVQIEIAGSPSFHRWHWESLKDPKFERPLVLQATLVRKNLLPQNTKVTLRPSTTINILIVTARPSGKGEIGYRTISRPMVEALRTANVPVQIDILRPGTYKALYEHLRESTEKHDVGYYHVIHLDLHGAVFSCEQYNAIQEQLHASPHLYQDGARYGRSEIELGVVAEEQQQWEQALDYYLKALETFVVYKDTYNSGSTLGNLALLWQQTNEDGQIMDKVVAIVGWTHEEVVKLFREYLEGERRRKE